MPEENQFSGFNNIPTLAELPLPLRWEFEDFGHHWEVLISENDSRKPETVLGDFGITESWMVVVLRDGKLFTNEAATSQNNFEALFGGIAYRVQNGMADQSDIRPVFKDRVSWIDLLKNSLGLSRRF